MIISFNSVKGGLGKTSSCVNLGYALSNKRKRNKVLLVDLDPQAGLTHHVSHKHSKKYKASLHDVLKNNCGIEDAIHEYCKNLHFIPVSYKLYEVSPDEFEKNLPTSIEKIKKDYDFIFFDLPPSSFIGMLTPLLISDYLIIPVDCQGALSILGLQTAEKIISESMKRVKINSLDLLGILPTFLDRTKVSKEVLQFLENHYKEYLLPPIRRNTSIAQASSLGKTIFEHKPKSMGAEDYTKLAKTFLDIMKKKEDK